LALLALLAIVRMVEAVDTTYNNCVDWCAAVNARNEVRHSQHSHHIPSTPRSEIPMSQLSKSAFSNGSQPYFLRLFPALALTAALAACGGSDNASPPP